MASTSTNKQPLLVDRVLHVVKKLSEATNNGITIQGSNSAQLLVDSTSYDGAIIEDVYLISNDTNATHTVNLYLSTGQDYLRTSQGEFIGQVISSSSAIADVTRMVLPRTLTPVPNVGTDPFNHALYIPKGFALWAAVQSSDAQTNTERPTIGVQGGWY